MSKPKEVFIVGLDAFNRSQLENLRHANRYRYHELLSFDEIKRGGNFSFNGALEKAGQRLDAFTGKPDAIVTFWDFPATLLLAALTTRQNLPGPSLESTLKCEHKFWSRREQARVIDACPRFQSVDPFAADAADRIELDFPYWIKPMKGTDSFLAFKVEDRAGLDQALEQIRAGIGPTARAFNHVLERADLPAEIRALDGRHCIVEGLLVGTQHTVGGFVHHGRVTTYGVVDSLNYPDSSSFLSYEYPSALAPAVSERMCELSRTVIAAIGLDHCPFNIEFFYDAPNDRIQLLEINPRVSQSHSEIFRNVDGDSDEEIAVQVALGEEPDWRPGSGQWAFAAKYYIRRFADGIVRAVPSDDDLKRLHEEFPEAELEINVSPGARLSDTITKDSYSFDVAHIHVGADSREALQAKFERIRDRLNFQIEAIENVPG